MSIDSILSFAQELNLPFESLAWWGVLVFPLSYILITVIIPKIKAMLQHPGLVLILTVCILILLYKAYLGGKSLFPCLQMTFLLLDDARNLEIKHISIASSDIKIILFLAIAVITVVGITIEWSIKPELRKLFT